MNLRHRIQLALLSGCASLFSLLGFGGLSRLGSGFGRLMWHALPARRKLATDNIIRHLNLPENAPWPAPASATTPAHLRKFC